MSRLLLSGWYGNGNLGDEAILDGIVRAVRASEPEVQIAVLSDDVEETEGRLDVEAVPRSGRRLLEEARAIARSDLFVLGGGGLVKDYGGAPGAADVWLKPLVCARLLGRQTMTYALGADPLRFPVSAARARRALRFAQTITARDEGSAAALRQAGVRAPILVTADPAILVGDPQPKPQDGSPPLVGVNIRHWFARGRSIEDPAAVARVELELARGLDSLIESNGARVLFVPFRRRNGDDDLVAWGRVLRNMAHRAAVEEADLPATPAAASAVLGRCDFVIGARLHSLILAAANGVPVYGLAYMPKVEHFLAALQLGGAASRLEEAGAPGQLAGELRRWFERRHETRVAMLPQVASLRDVALANGALCAALLRRDKARAAGARRQLGAPAAQVERLAA